jgi:hypothetical protein
MMMRALGPLLLLPILQVGHPACSAPSPAPPVPGRRQGRQALHATPLQHALVCALLVSQRQLGLRVLEVR